MSSSSRTLSDWRELFTRTCRSSVTGGVHSVTFQPTPGATNEDRFVAHEWLIHGRPWKFLAVFDGKLLGRSLHLILLTAQLQGTEAPSQLNTLLPIFRG